MPKHTKVAKLKLVKIAVSDQDLRQFRSRVVGEGKTVQAVIGALVAKYAKAAK